MGWVSRIKNVVMKEVTEMKPELPTIYDFHNRLFFWPKIRVIKYPKSAYIVQTRKWFNWKDVVGFEDEITAINYANMLFETSPNINKKQVIYKL